MKIALNSSITIFIFTVFCCSTETTSDRSIDQEHSLRVQAKNFIYDSDSLLKLGLYDQVSILLDSAELVSLELHDSSLFAAALNNRGVLHFRRGDFDKSIDCYSRALDVAIHINDSLNIGARLQNIGMSLKQKGMYNTSIRYYQDALDILKVQQNDRQLGSVYNSIGNIYKRLKDFGKALLMYENAQYHWQKIHYENGIAMILGNRGNTLLEMGEVNEAISAYYEALEIKRDLGNKSSISATLNNLGEAYLLVKEYGRSENYFVEALKIKQAVGDKKGIALVFNNFGSLELSKNNLLRAKYWIDKGYELANELDVSDLKLDNIQLQKQLSAQSGDFKRAFELDAIFDQMKDIAFNDQILKVQELQSEYDLQQEEKRRQEIQNELDIANVRAENQLIKSQIQQIVIIAAIIAIIIVGYFAYTLRNKNRHIENLIRELHHRVKNHLGMISGMFGAQTGLSLTDTAVLDEAKTRVEAVNGIHRRLYRQDEYEYVNMKEYLEELVDNNALVFGLFNKIEKHFEIHEQIMDIDKAISVGLIANEVLTNAFKYGLQDTPEPKLKIVLEKAIKGYKMIIFNNAESDNSTGGGFGGELISRLAQNLKGQIQVIKQGGFQFELTFP